MLLRMILDKLRHLRGLKIGSITIKEDIMFKSNIIRQLRIDEGVRYKAYTDHLGIWTIGVGHLISKDEDYLLTAVLDDKTVDDILWKDLDIAINDAQAVFGKKVFDSFPMTIREVIINMLFNLGRTRFLQFKKTIKYFNNREWKKAAEEMKDSKWFHQVPYRANRLSIRVGACSEK